MEKISFFQNGCNLLKIIIYFLLDNSLSKFKTAQSILVYYLNAESQEQKLKEIDEENKPKENINKKVTEGGGVSTLWIRRVEKESHIKGLKVVFAKNERGYRLNAIKKRF